MKNIKVTFTFPNDKVISRFVGHDDNGYFTTQHAKATAFEPHMVDVAVRGFSDTLKESQKAIMTWELVDPLPPREKGRPVPTKGR